MLTPFIGFGLFATSGVGNSDWGVYKTTDAWRTSVVLTPDTILGNPPSQLKMFSETTGYIHHTTGLFKTLNGGAHWDMVSSVTNSGVGIVYTQNPDTVLILQGNYSLTTTDAGTWDSVPMPALSAVCYLLRCDSDAASM